MRRIVSRVLRVTAGSLKGGLALRMFAVGVAVVLAVAFWLLHEDRRRIARWKGEHRSLVDQKVETYPLFLR
jgi:Mg2+/citrate symporter